MGSERVAPGRMAYKVMVPRSTTAHGLGQSDGSVVAWAPKAPLA
jgi:hypothetical protein